MRHELWLGLLLQMRTTDMGYIPGIGSIATCLWRGMRTQETLPCLRILHVTQIAQDGILGLVLLDHLSVGLGTRDGLEPVGGGGIDRHAT